MDTPKIVHHWKALVKRWAQPLAAALAIMAMVYSAGLARSRDVRVVYLDTSALAHFDFGLPGFRLTAEERSEFEAAIQRRLEDEYSHWNIRFTLHRPAANSCKVVRFLESGSREAEPPLGFSAGFWDGESIVFLDGGSLAPLARDTALQIHALRSIALAHSEQRAALTSGRIHTLAECYGAIAAHEMAHSFGVIGHYGGQLMASEPRLSSHLGTLANWMIALSLG